MMKKLATPDCDGVSGNTHRKGIRHLKRNIIIIGIAFVLVVGLILGLWYKGYVSGKAEMEPKIADLEAEVESLKAEIQELIDTPVVIEPVTPEIVLDLIGTQYEEIDELATAEYLFTDSARFTDSKQIKNWNIPGTKKAFTLKWDGVIKAGIHVSQIGVNTNKAGDKITVTIPAAELFSYDVDEKNVELLDEKNNIFNPISVEDKLKFDVETEQYMKDRAIENGILTKAQENAKTLILDVLRSNPDIGADYEIEFVLA